VAGPHRRVCGLYGRKTKAEVDGTALRVMLLFAMHPSLQASLLHCCHWTRLEGVAL